MRRFLISLLFFLSFWISHSEFDRNNYFEADWQLVKQQIKENLYVELNNYLESQGAPGGCIGIHYIETIEVCAGVSDTTEKTPITANMSYRIASTTKTFTAVGILRLISEGKLTLNTTIEQFFPNLQIPNKNIITIYQLLHMSSGLYGYLEAYYTFEGMQLQYTKEELIQTAINKGVQFVPGEGYSYCNTNYLMLGMIIEQLSEQTYSDYIKNLVEDLGLEKTFEPTDSQMPEPFVKGYVHNEDSDIEVDSINPSSAFATGSMISTVQEMTKWTRLLFDDKIVLDEQGMKDLLDFSVEMDAGFYGGGVEKYTADKLGPLPAEEIVGKVANIMGYTSIMTYAVKERMSVVVFINYENQMAAFLAANMAMNTMAVIKDITDNFKPAHFEEEGPMDAKYMMHFVIFIGVLFMILAFFKA